MFDFYEDVVIPILKKLITQRSLPELEIEPSDYFQLLSEGKLELNEIESKEFVEGLDSRRIAFVLLKGIQYMQETRREVQLLSEIYGEQCILGED